MAVETDLLMVCLDKATIKDNESRIVSDRHNLPVIDGNGQHGALVIFMA